jgi:hypothetical protein
LVTFPRICRQPGRQNSPWRPDVFNRILSTTTQNLLPRTHNGSTHQGIKGATPAELYFGKRPACTEARRPPRAYEKKSEDKLFEIAYLDPEFMFPVLLPKPIAA